MAVVLAVVATAVVAVGAGVTTKRAAAAASGPGAGEYVSLAPTRVFDSRTQGGPIGANQVLTVPVTGVGGVPTSGVSAVAFTLTALPLTGASSDYLTVYPFSSPQPSTSNLNPLPGTNVADAVIVPPGPGGDINIYNLAGSVNVLIDISGYYTGGNSSTTNFHVLPSPVRIVNQGQLGPGQTTTIPIDGVAGIPSTGVAAVAVAIGALGPTASSYTTAYADGTTRPAVSSSLITAGQDVTVLAQPQVGSDGAIDIYNNAGTFGLKVDVEGYYATGVGGGSATYRPVAPTVVYDSRQTNGPYGGTPFGPGNTRTITVAGSPTTTPVSTPPPVTPPNTTAVAVTITTTNATARSYIEEYPTGQSPPSSPTAVIDTNPTAGAATADLVLAKTGTNGEINLYNSLGSTDLIVSIVGYYLDTTTTNAPAPLNLQSDGSLYDAPDPSAFQVSTTASQIYATGTSLGHTPFNIFTQSWTTGTGSTQPAAGGSEALPTPPPLLTAELAPTVALIGGLYVMWFSGSDPSSGQPNCLYSATSTVPTGNFSFATGPYCYPSSGYGLFDPSIFQDPRTGAFWLLYSSEGATGTAKASIHAVALSANGTAFASGATDYTIAVQADVANGLAAEGANAPAGSNPEIENPQMDLDYSNQTSPDGNPILYDLYMSYGSYDTANSDGTAAPDYHTVEIACEAITGPCYDSNPGLLDSSLEAGESQAIINPGGLSLVTGGHIGEYALFAGQLSGDTPPRPAPGGMGKRGLFYENASSIQGSFATPTGNPTQPVTGLPPAIRGT